MPFWTGLGDPFPLARPTLFLAPRSDGMTRTSNELLTSLDYRPDPTDADQLEPTKEILAPSLPRHDTVREWPGRPAARIALARWRR